MPQVVLLLASVLIAALCLWWINRERRSLAARPSPRAPRNGEPDRHKWRRFAFFLVYCIPTGFALAYWRGYAYPIRQALIICAASLGGLLVAALSCTTLVPWVVRHFATPETAYRWQCAAFDAIGYTALFPLGWVLLKFPLPIWVLLPGYFAGVLAVLVGLAWLDKRWLHFDVYQRFWDWGDR